jgi:hypothetical protein
MIIEINARETPTIPAPASAAELAMKTELAGRKWGKQAEMPVVKAPK